MGLSAAPDTTRPPTTHPSACPADSPTPCTSTSVAAREGPASGTTDSASPLSAYTYRAAPALRTRAPAAVSASTCTGTAPASWAGLTHSTSPPLIHRLATPETVPKLHRTPASKGPPCTCSSSPPSVDPTPGSTASTSTAATLVSATSAAAAGAPVAPAAAPSASRASSRAVGAAS